MRKCRFSCAGALLLVGCGGGVPTPETPREQSQEQYGEPAQQAELSTSYDFDAAPAPTTGSAAQDDKWWEAEGACPEGSARYGGTPPEHDRVGCKTPQGKNEGRLTRFFPSGVKEEEGSNQNHFAEGVWTVWGEDGKKLSETFYVKGKKHGLESVWYPGGVLKSQRPYADGRRHGIVVIWDEQERKRTVLTYDGGKKHGQEARWSVEGDLVQVIDWDHDVEK